VTLLLTTFWFSVGSALIPILNVEVYLGAIATQTGQAAALGLSLVAALGQTVGKIVWYVGTRKSFESDWVQKRLDRPKVRTTYDKWHLQAEGRPWYAAGVLFLSSSVGLPPLLIMAAVAGALRMNFWVFVGSVFVGRFLRFYLIIAGVAFVTG
jgi:membrane protein YqaA with SNARE-associated domain